MEILSALLLGLLQGATEFLPVSSSGHLILVESWFNIQEAGLTFDVGLHLGTILAVLAYFRKDFIGMASSLLPGQNSSEAVANRRILFLIVMGTIPAGVAGVLLNDIAETLFRSPLLVSGTLAGFGLLLLLADKMGSHHRSFTSLALSDAMIIGCAQAMALVPGVSRSGITMTAALFLGLARPDAARFSFLLSAPIILGAGLIHLPDILKQGAQTAQPYFFLTGFLAAAVSGYFFIAFLIRFLEKRSLAIFAWYRVLLAALIWFTLLP